MEQLIKYVNEVSPITKEAEDDFLNIFRKGKLTRNDYFATYGEYSSKIAFVCSGTLRAFYRSKKGQEYNKTIFIPPCFIAAYSSLITRNKNQIYIQALEDCEVLIANYTRASELYDKHHCLERFSRKLSESFFVAKEHREIDIVLLSATERYAKFQKDFPGLEQRIPQYHIASYLGVTPTQLSRIRKELSLP
ncbi:Crp/Fnr family transcriptional regulator [Fulvivirgaceae bacterium BMA10]|uniref:Crp/Fnr family transcriptional regulator n=1 Tax=Splendidivirga corallicola TaxID=3051826 RepID=A0ABT8KQN0_9BACT|nr:Crp/Fnr family transcriptional regulator [Fulvivirgaceae bacterium BMA10]